MIDPISSALPGLSAAERRFDTQTVNLQARDPSSASPTAGAPIAEAAVQSMQAPPPSAVTPDGVEGASATERESGFDGTYASLRSSTPSYLVVYDARADQPDEQGSIASESNPDASQARADKNREEANAANQQTLEATNATVQKRFGIGSSF